MLTKHKLDDKEWLYEQYWGEIRSTKDIANEVDASTRKVIERLSQHGIPRRPRTWQRPLAINPLEGFEIERTKRGEEVRDCPMPRNTLPNCLDLNNEN